jgi:hypothetical protein
LTEEQFLDKIKASNPKNLPVDWGYSDPAPAPAPAPPVSSARKVPNPPLSSSSSYPPKASSSSSSSSSSTYNNSSSNNSSSSKQQKVRSAASTHRYDGRHLCSCLHSSPLYLILSASTLFLPLLVALILFPDPFPCSRISAQPQQW